MLKIGPTCFPMTNTMKDLAKETGIEEERVHTLFGAYYMDHGNVDGISTPEALLDYKREKDREAKKESTKNKRVLVVQSQSTMYGIKSAHPFSIQMGDVKMKFWNVHHFLVWKQTLDTEGKEAATKILNLDKDTLNNKTAVALSKWDLNALEDALYYAFRESFLQNKNLLEALIKTGTSNIVYKNATNVVYKTILPKVLYRIRSEFKGYQDKTYEASTYKIASSDNSGADQYWTEMASRYGILEIQRWSEKNEGGKDSRKVTQEDIKKYEDILYGISKKLGRRYSPEKDYYKALIALMQIVDGSDALYVVSSIDKNGNVSGGAGWAVARAQSLKKLVYVFNQKDNSWYRFDSGKDKWLKLNTVPKLSKNAAVLGVKKQSLSKEGKKAIEDVFENTFGKIQEGTEDQNENRSPLIRTAREGEKKRTPKVTIRIVGGYDNRINTEAIIPNAAMYGFNVEKFSATTFGKMNKEDQEALYSIYLKVCERTKKKAISLDDTEKRQALIRILSIIYSVQNSDTVFASDELTEKGGYSQYSTHIALVASHILGKDFYFLNNKNGKWFKYDNASNSYIEYEATDAPKLTKNSYIHLTPREDERSKSEFLRMIHELGTSQGKRLQKKIELNEVNASTNILDSKFTPIIKRDRISMVAKDFSNLVTSEMKKEIERLEGIIRDKEALIADLETSKKENELKSEKVRLSVFKRKLKSIQDPENVECRIAFLNNTGFTPENLFEKIRNRYLAYVNGDLSAIRAAELAKYTQEDLDTFTGEDYDSIDNEINYKKEAFKVVTDDMVFKALVIEAAKMISIREGIAIRVNVKNNAINSTVNHLENSNLVQDDLGASYREEDVLNKEEKIFEGWQMDVRQMSNYNSLSRTVREIISNIKRVDRDGYAEEDDLGNYRLLDANYAHTMLMDILRPMIEPKDLIPILENAIRQFPWMAQVVSILKGNSNEYRDENITSLFYQDFQKEFLNYWKQNVKKQWGKDKKSGKSRVIGTTTKTIRLNRPSGVYYLFDQWRDNHEAGKVLTNEEDSLYNKNGEVIVDAKKVNRLLSRIAVLKDKLTYTEDNRHRKQQITVSQLLNLLQEEDVLNEFDYLLKTVGINIDINLLSEFEVKMDDENSEDEDPRADPSNITTILDSLTIIIKGTTTEEFNPIIREDGKEDYPDLLNTFGSAYNTIAVAFAGANNNAIESSFRNKGKSYYSHASLSYLGKLLKKFKMQKIPGRTSEDFTKFVQDEFAQYDPFYRDMGNGETWTLQIFYDLFGDREEDGTFSSKDANEFQNAIEHKIVLTYKDKEYNNWSDADYTAVLINEFFAEGAKSKWAYYALPVLADVASAEFLRLRKYTQSNGGRLGHYDRVRDEYLDWDNFILERLKEFAVNEYERIRLVRERAKNPDRKEIDFYDTKGNKFLLFPLFNTLVFEGKSLIEALDDSYGTTDFDDYMNAAVKIFMETEFEKAIKEWRKVGLLNTNSFGDFVNINSSDINSHKGMRENIRRGINSILTKLEAAKIEVNEELQEKIQKVQHILDSPYKNLEFESLTKGDLIEMFTPIAELYEYALNEGIKKEELDKDFSLSSEDTISEKVSEYVNILYLSDQSPIYKFKEFFYNSTLGMANVLVLTTSDIAFYKNVTNFIKRAKQIGAPVSRLNTDATWDGRKVLKNENKMEKCLYIEDQMQMSPYIKEIERALDNSVENGYITESMRDYIVNQYKDNINTTDGQSYRSITSYRKIMIMAGQWDIAMENIYNKIIEGRRSGKVKLDFEDLTVLFQPKKPFLFSQPTIHSGVFDADGKEYLIKGAVSHKNSEFLLLTAVSEMFDRGAAAKLRAIDDFMEKYDIDVVHFASAVKSGCYGKIDLNDIDAEDPEAYEKTMARLKASTQISEDGNRYDVNMVHEIPYEDYGFITPTPPHLLDITQSVGTQIRKLIMSDLEDDEIFTIDNLSMTKKQWVELYQATQVDNLIESYQEARRLFSSPKALSKALLAEIDSNPIYGDDLKEACQYDEEHNRINLPIFDNIQRGRIQRLLNSIIRNRVTRQKINGGTAIQVTSYGLSQKLKIEYGKREDGKTYIKAYQCLLPAWTKEFFEPLLNEEGILDITKLPEEARKMIGYRVPTEDKYSMIPLKVVGFLPMQQGTSIMLPLDIVKQTGSDFDIDKLYLMFPTLKSYRYDVKKALKIYNDETKENIKEPNEDFIEWVAANFHHKDSKNLEIPNSFNGAYETIFIVDRDERYQKVLDTKNTKEEDFSTLLKSLPSMTRNQRDNIIIDLMNSVLNAPSVMPNILNPGAMKLQADGATLSKIIEYYTPDEIQQIAIETGILPKDFKEILGKSGGYALGNKAVREELQEKGIKFITRKVKKYDSSLNKRVETKSYSFALGYELLKFFTPEKLEELIDNKENAENPLSVVTQVKYQQLNMSGANLIGAYANQNVNHAIAQYTDLRINPKFAFTFMGRSETALNKSKYGDGKLITRIVSGFIGAAADNAKEQLLYWLHQDSFTVDVTLLLSRLGYEPKEVMLLLKQPIIQKMRTAYAYSDHFVADKKTIVRSILREYKEIIGEDEETGNIIRPKYAKAFGNCTFDEHELLEALAIAKNSTLIDTYSTVDEEENGKLLDVMTTSEEEEDLNTEVFLEEIKQKQAEERERRKEISKKNKEMNALYYQYNVGKLFLRMMTVAEELKELVDVTRADTQKGSTGTTYGEDLAKYHKLKEFKKKFKLDPEEQILQGIEFLDGEITEGRNGKSLRDTILASKIPMLEAFTSFTIGALPSYFGQHVPFFRQDFLDMLDRISLFSNREELSDKMIEKIINHAIGYVLMDLPFFGADNFESASMKRSKIINQIPKSFLNLLDKSENFKNNLFVRRLSYKKSDYTCPVPRVIFKNVGNLSEDLKLQMRSELVSLMNNSEENGEIRQFAYNLVIYSMFRDLLGFSPKGFSHLTPINLLLTIPGYTDKLYSILDNDKIFNGFEMLFIRNNLYEPEFRNMINRSSDLVQKKLFLKIKGKTALADEVRLKPSEIPTYINPLGLPKGSGIFAFNLGERGTQYYYYQDATTLDGKGEFIIKKLQPLGKKNNFYEYEYLGNSKTPYEDAMEIVSVIQPGISRGMIQNGDNLSKKKSKSGGGVSEEMVKLFMGDDLQQEKGGEEISKPTALPNTKFEDNSLSGSAKDAWALWEEAEAAEAAEDGENPEDNPNEELPAEDPVSTSGKFKEKYGDPDTAFSQNEDAKNTTETKEDNKKGNIDKYPSTPTPDAEGKESC